MDFESTEILRSLVQIVQMKLVRRARYCAPIAERKHEAAEVSSHPVFTIYPYLAAMQLEYGPVAIRLVATDGRYGEFTPLTPGPVTRRELFRELLFFRIQPIAHHVICV